MAVIGEMLQLTIGDKTYTLPTGGEGTITKVQTSAGTHSTINVSSGAASFNVPTKTSHLTNDSGFITTVTTSGNGNAITAITASNGALTATKGTTFLTSHQDISGKADKATTLAGYGITDAKIASGVITLGSNTITPLTSSSTLSASKLSGAIPSAVTATTQASTDNSTKIATTAYVTAAIAALPEPMVFKGSVGTGGTITSLPTAAASNEGHTYKVITDLSSPSAKVGDTVISNGSSWIVIPSGDEPGGTVTSVGVSNGGGLSVSGSPVTSSGTITISHADTSSQASSSNSGRTYIQSVTLDTYGHVTGISTATETVTNTDTKLQVAAVTSGTTYYPIVGTGTTAATRQYDTTGFVYVGTNGTTSAVGTAILTLGNSTASGTANNKQGQLILYGSTQYATTITPGAPSAARTITLPNKTGTVALTTDIPTVPTSAVNATTGISVADHTTTTIIGVQSSTTTASKASGGNGSVPTLGTAFTVPNVTAKGSGSFTQGSFSGGSFTQGTDSFTTNTPTVINTSKFSGGSFTRGTFSGGSGSFTSGTFSGGSGSFSATVSNHVLSFSHTHTAATHGADSHTHTAATHAADSFTAASFQSGFYTAGTAASFTQGEDSFTPATHGSDTHVHTAPTLGTAFTIPNVTSVGSASTWSFSDVTVPIKNSSSTTVVTSKTHSVTDGGHTHTLS